MKTVLFRVLTVLGIFALANASYNNAVADDKKKEATLKEIHEIMSENYSGDSLKKSLKGLLAEKDVKWSDVSSKAKTWKQNADDLAKNKPEKGDEKSWKSLTEKYAEEAKNLATAAEKKELDNVKKAYAYLTDNKTCKTCHTVHK